MGHYASEMDPEWGSEIDEIRQWLKAGYRNPSHGQLLACPKCAAVVRDWRKHEQWHKEELGR
jgi:hypothetical protein